MSGFDHTHDLMMIKKNVSVDERNSTCYGWKDLPTVQRTVAFPSSTELAARPWSEHTCKEQQRTTAVLCSILLVFLSSTHHRRTNSGLITGNRFCADESLLAMQNIWFNVSIFHHGLTAARVSSAPQFPWTPILDLFFFVYANLSVFCLIWFSLIISILLGFFPLFMYVPLHRMPSFFLSF